MNHVVAISAVRPAAYPAAPFDPPNPVYAAVEETFAQLGLDAGRQGTASWNPLGFIRRGSRVLVKPNLVRHFHPYGYSADSLYTHGSIIRAVCDYVFKALGDSGELVVADAPLQSCDFNRVCELSGVRALETHYAGVGRRLIVRDLRLVRAETESRGWLGRLLVQRDNTGDPLGYTTMRLDEHSLHAERERDGKYRVTCYDPLAMGRHHGGGRHRYIIANTLLEADVVINLPKVKTHQKAGITGALKNFVGINGHKDCLPHHVAGPAEQGGDEYALPSLAKRLDSWMQDYKEAHGDLIRRKAVAVAHRVLEPLHMRQAGNEYWAGSWYGNDTISRTTVDLNRIVCYGRRDGSLAREPQRQLLHICDAVIAGEGNGPLAPTPKPAGLILGGANAVAVDMMLARMMGFNWHSIPTIQHAADVSSGHPIWDGGSVRSRSGDPNWNNLGPESPGPALDFEAHRGWKHHIEREVVVR